MTTGNLQYSNAITQIKSVTMKDAENWESENSNPQDPELDSATPETKPETKSVDWEKRYGDQQAYLTKLKNEHKTELEALKASVTELQKKAKESKKLEYPATDEEISDWKANFPKVHDIFQTIARKEFEDSLSDKDQEIAELKQLLQTFGQQQGRVELRKFHADADEIENSPEFELWLSSQRPAIQQLARGGVEDVAKLLDLYKNEVGLTSAAKKQQIKEASKVVTKNSSANIPADKKVWKESDLMRLNNRQLEKLLPEIEKARAEGRFEYDLTNNQF